MYYGCWNWKYAKSKFSNKWYQTLCSCCITLSIRENIKLLKQLDSGFKRTIIWNKYLAKTVSQARNRYWDYLIDPSFQKVNRLFALPLIDDGGQESHKKYFVPTVWIKDYNAMINRRNFFSQPTKNDLKTW